MKLGFYYQSAEKPFACEKSLQRLREVYPDAPVCLFSDGDHRLKELSVKYGCDYLYDDKIGTIDPTGKFHQSAGLEEMLIGLHRIKMALETSLSDCTHIILYEDDVWALDPVVELPDCDIGGGFFFMYPYVVRKWLQDILKCSDDEIHTFSPTQNCLGAYVVTGGAFFRKDSFLVALDAFLDLNLGSLYWEVPFREMGKLNVGLNLMFQATGMKTLYWHGCYQCVNNHIEPNRNFAHNYKRYY